MKLKCDCCEIEREFVDAEEAFQQGWDAPPHFTGYVSCDLCPANTQFSPLGWAQHATIHEAWAKNGRPEEFSQETCLAPEDRIPQERLDDLQVLLKHLGVDVAEFKGDIIDGIQDDGS